MIKKAAILTGGVLLLLALMFGSRLVPYAQTAYEKARNAVNDSVPIEFQLDAAEKLVKQIDQERFRMVQQIAKEKIAIDKLETKVSTSQINLERQYAHIMKLRDHLGSGDSHYVTHRNRKVSTTKVKEELANHFTQYKTANSTLEKTIQIVDARRGHLEAAKNELDTMLADQQNLKLEIQNLRARMHMLEIAESANHITVDDSHLSRTHDMIDDIKARLDVKAEVLSMMPSYTGSIPMDDESYEVGGDIVEDIDAYFSEGDDDVVFN